MEKAGAGFGFFNKNRLLYSDFQNLYGLTILPKSLSIYNPGDVVEWDKKGILDYENYSFIDDLNLEKEQSDLFKNKLENAPKTESEFTSVEMNRTTGFGINLTIPNIGLDIKAKFGADKLVKFSYKDIQGRIIGKDINGQIRKIIINAKEEDKRNFRKNLKNKLIFSELYYVDSFEMIIERTTEVEVGVALEQFNIEPEISVENSKELKVIFQGSTTCPFAARIESLNDYVD